MKKISKLHHIIDRLSVFLLLYCILVQIGLAITPFITNECVRALLVTLVPLVVLQRQVIDKSNKLLHLLFGFFR